MWNTPTDNDLKGIPDFYETEKVPLKNKVIHMHFFLGGCDWYACEYSPEEQIFFGYAILNNDLDNAEWGYFALEELSEVKAGGFLEVDRDLHFPPTKAKDIENIRRAGGV